MTIYLIQRPAVPMAVAPRELRQNADKYTELKATYRETRALLRSQKEELRRLEQSIGDEGPTAYQHQAYLLRSQPTLSAPTLRKGMTPDEYDGMGDTDVDEDRQEWGLLKNLDAEGRAAFLSLCSRPRSKPGSITKSTSGSTNGPAGCGLDFGSDSTSD
jgi:hypothetical protein